MPMLKKNQCMWIIHPNQFIHGKFTSAEYCGAVKQMKSGNPNYPDEGVTYESFCPKHMYEWTRIRKAKAANEVNEDDWSV